jgi:hypothetical protein
MDKEKFKQLVDNVLDANEELNAAIGQLSGDELTKYWNWFNSYDRVKKMRKDLEASPFV